MNPMYPKKHKLTIFIEVYTQEQWEHFGHGCQEYVKLKLKVELTNAAVDSDKSLYFFP